MHLRPRGPVRDATTFRKHFSVDDVPSEAVLFLRAVKQVCVRLDGQVVVSPSSNLKLWKTAHRINIGPEVSPGEHEISITVLNRNGPGLVSAYCKPLNLFTGQGRQASRDQRVRSRRAFESFPSFAELPRWRFPTAPCA